MSDLWLARPDEQGNNQPEISHLRAASRPWSGYWCVDPDEMGIGRFTDDDETMLSAIAGQAANTIENARLYEKRNINSKSPAFSIEPARLSIPRWI